MTKLSLFLAAALATAAPAARAKSVQGPVLTYEQDADSAVSGGDKGAKPRDLAVARKRYEVNLLVPIPAKVPGGMLVVKADLFKERRDYAGADAAGGQSVDVKKPNAGGFGAVFVPHASEGAPKFFVVLERYGYLSTERKARPMGEYVLGADIADDDMPFHLKFSASDETETRLLVRLRHFPGFDKWLFYVGHKIETRSGVSLDAAFPSHALVGWRTAAAAWKFYAGGRAVSREYPMDFSASQSGWLDGAVGYGLVGVRRKLEGPLFAALELGAQKEWLDWRDQTGKVVQQYETNWVPMARVALETWIETP